MNLLPFTALAARKSSSARHPHFHAPYVTRLASFFVFTFLLGLYLTFSPRVNYDFFYNQVLFSHHKCTSLRSSWFTKNAREVVFTNNKGYRLSAMYFVNPKSDRVLLIHHGSVGNINWQNDAARIFYDSGVSVFVYDYSGYGKSEGTPTVTGLADDARSAFDYLVTNEHVPPSQIVHYGVSLGTGPATSIASSKPCAGLVLFAPYASLKSAARDSYFFLQIYPDFLIADADLETLDNIRKVRAPILIIHGAKDRCIRVHNSDRLYAALAGRSELTEYMRIPDAGHTELTTQKQLDHILSFIKTAAHQQLN